MGKWGNLGRLLVCNYISSISSIELIAYRPIDNNHNGFAEVAMGRHSSKQVLTILTFATSCFATYRAAQWPEGSAFSCAMLCPSSASMPCCAMLCHAVPI